MFDPILFMLLTESIELFFDSDDSITLTILEISTEKKYYYSTNSNNGI